MSTVSFPNDGAIRISQPYIGYNFPFIYAEGELLSGAADSGGINAGSGFVAQANLNLGFASSPVLALVGTLGRMEALSGDLKANVLWLALAYGENVYSVRSGR